MAEFVKQTEKPSFDDLMRKYRKQHRDIAVNLKLHEYYMTPAEKKIVKRKEALKRKQHRTPCKGYLCLQRKETDICLKC